MWYTKKRREKFALRFSLSVVWENRQQIDHFTDFKKH